MASSQTMLIAAVAAVLVASVAADDDGGCRDAGGDPTSVESFSASYYTANVVLHEESMLNITLGGGEAGMKLFKVVKQCLEDHQQCNADSVAYTFGQALARARSVSLQGYFKNIALTVGRSLFKFGILNCSNSVALSLEFLHFGFVEFNKYPKDLYNFENYMHNSVYSLVDLVLAHGISLEDTAQDIADTFYETYRDEQPDCKLGKSSN
ncbi:hypothetical protein JTE90_001485 [Oedothorax gibbosus]|uniref:Uncharacterized protein n=1 Tax=Oedothorax gibbosus TaxID=931172 RepID=A0AAV6TQZ6_9ARAC|nr:hypothetical protein JTE90_001485 [Oedothorax gibbosus]